MGNIITKSKHHRFNWPLAHKVSLDFSTEKLMDSFEKLQEAAIKNKLASCYEDSECFDLTYIKGSNFEYNEPWVGSPSCRANKDKSWKRLRVQKNLLPSQFDGNHNVIYDWAKSSYAIKVAQKLGRIHKVSFASLKPNGWWPVHYDFHPGLVTKWNLVLSTNPKCHFLIWNPRQQKLEKINMKIGEAWFVNTGFYHAAHNWGDTTRIHLLVTIADAGNYRDCF